MLFEISLSNLLIKDSLFCRHARMLRAFGAMRLQAGHSMRGQYAHCSSTAVIIRRPKAVIFDMGGVLIPSPGLLFPSEC